MTATRDEQSLEGISDLNAQSIESQHDSLIEQMLGDTNSVWRMTGIYIGDKLDLFSQLARLGPITPSAFAEATNLNGRYLREWLEQQTVSGVLAVEPPVAEWEEHRFYVPEGHVEVLTERDSANYLAPLAQITIGALHPVAQVVDAFRTGGGLHFHEYGSDMREGQGRMNRNLFLFELGRDVLPSIPDVHDRLKSTTSARIADIGCGIGYSSIGMANAYPNAHVDGFDLDEPSVHDAQRNVAEAGLQSRVTVQFRDAGDAELAGRYDLVTAFECIHDMSDPVGVLSSMRRLAGDDGAVLIMDERVPETFTPESNDVERIMYGFSILHCLPVGMADQPSVGTGTVMRPSTLRQYALEAGFREVEILPIENYFFNFYRLYQ